MFSKTEDSKAIVFIEVMAVRDVITFETLMGSFKRELIDDRHLVITWGVN
jgi:hypothetical protein